MSAMKTPLSQTRSPGGTYGNPRVRLARRNLLTAGDIRAFLQEPNFDAFFKKLSENSVYGSS